MKELVGKCIFLSPTGNNVRRGCEDKIISATVNKVSRSFATITIEGCGLECKYRINGNHLDSGHNSGYYVFTSEQELADKYFVKKVADKIVDKFPYKSDYAKLDRKTITKIAELLDIKL